MSGSFPTCDLWYNLNVFMMKVSTFILLPLKTRCVPGFVYNIVHRDQSEAVQVSHSAEFPVLWLPLKFVDSHVKGYILDCCSGMTSSNCTVADLTISDHKLVLLQLQNWTNTPAFSLSEPHCVCFSTAVVSICFHLLLKYLLSSRNPNPLPAN